MDDNQFDYVIVGAGAAGCILANRLSADGRSTVCLLEAGPADRNLYLHIPGGFIKAVSNPRYTWQFKTEPGEGSGGRRISIIQGRTLGGSTAINGLIYNRGQAADYDGWADAGNPGWRFADVLPYFKRSERRVGAGDPSVRGIDGELPITDCDWRSPLCDAFISAAGTLGMPAGIDYNGHRQRGAGYYQRWIENGWRVSTAKAFLAPVRGRGNLHVRTHAHVTKLVFEGKRAVGVQFVAGPDAPSTEVRARREVILCAGAANTPKLLQISGVGSQTLIEGIGVPLVHRLDGVGENLRDHYMIRLVARARNVETINDLAQGPRLWREIARWALKRPSILAISPSVAFGFANTQDPNLDADIQLNFTPGSYKESRSGVLDSFPGFTLGVFQMRPKSVGYVRARSARPFEHPEIQPNYLAHEEDRRTVIDGIRLARRILETDPLAQYCERIEFPPDTSTSDDELLEFARNLGNTAYHPMGTCRMGPREDPMSVVDAELRVHGVHGLRIADSSVMPAMPSANIGAAVFMIAEKAADLIQGRNTATAAHVDSPAWPQGTGPRDARAA